ncbi:MAG: OmpA family protein [Pseudomonadota bacterium]
MAIATSTSSHRRRAAIPFAAPILLVTVLALSGCAGLFKDWEVQKKALTDGVDQTATQEALVPRLPIIRFELGETRPSPAAEAELRAVSAELMDLDEEVFVVLVEGHTDATGPADINEAIALQRAQSVADILIDEGVNPDLISVSSFGSELPVASNELDDGSDHPTGRRFNRRVEVMIAPRTVLGERDQITASTT